MSQLLEKVAAGERVVISKAGTPVADLVPHRAATVAAGGMKGEIAYSDEAFGLESGIRQMFYGPQAGEPGCLGGTGSHTKG